jgi:hypothetical protein
MHDPLEIRESRLESIGQREARRPVVLDADQVRVLPAGVHDTADRAISANDNVEQDL